MDLFCLSFAKWPKFRNYLLPSIPSTFKFIWKADLEIHNIRFIVSLSLFYFFDQLFSDSWQRLKAKFGTWNLAIHVTGHPKLESSASFLWFLIAVSLRHLWLEHPGMAHPNFTAFEECFGSIAVMKWTYLCFRTEQAETWPVEQSAIMRDSKLTWI